MDNTIEIVNSVKDLHAMPSVIVKALNVMKQPTASIKSLGDVIIYDQSLTIKILALVNSAYYGFSQQITSINMALSLLGLVKIKNIIVAVAMKPMMSHQDDKEIWKHSIKVAVGCEYLAGLTKLMDADDAFISGFIHDIGKMVLQNYDSKLYSKSIKLIQDGATSLEAEKKLYETDHVRTGVLLAKRWQLPVLLTNIVFYHHNPEASSIPLPCSLVKFVDAIVSDNYDISKVDLNFLESMSIDPEDVEDLRQVVLQKANLLISELI